MLTLVYVVHFEGYCVIFESQANERMTALR